jgi:hypothetical protein
LLQGEASRHGFVIDSAEMQRNTENRLLPAASLKTFGCRWGRLGFALIAATLPGSKESGISATRPLSLFWISLR